MAEQRDPNKEPGFAELSNVMGRLSRRAGLGHTPQQLHQAAQHIYYGNSEGPLPQDHPMLQRSEWQKLAQAGDMWSMPHGEGEQIFGKPAEYMRGRMARDRIGPGWTQQDLDNRRKQRLQDPNRGSWMNIAKSLLSTGDDYTPAQGELSPGDRQEHEWARDRELMDAFARRKQGSYAENEEAIRRAIVLAGGDPWSMPQDLDKALDHYERATANPDFAFGDYEGDPFGSSNHQSRSGLDAMVAALGSPDYLAGRVTAPLNSVNQFLNHMTTRNPTRQDPWIINNSLVNRKNSLIANMLGPVIDFGAGVGESIGSGELGQDIQDSFGQPKNLWTMAISPILTEEANSPEERDAVKKRQAGAYQDVDAGVAGDEYYWGKTGDYPSWLGSILMSSASEPVDLTTAATLGLGTAAGKIPLKAAALALGAEAVDEAKWGLPFTLGGSLAFEDVPPIQNWLTPGLEARTDLHEDPQAQMGEDEHRAWLQSQGNELRGKSQYLRDRTDAYQRMTNNPDRLRYVPSDAWPQ